MCKMIFLVFLLLVLLGLLNKMLLRILAIALVCLLIYKEFYYYYNHSLGYNPPCFWRHLHNVCGIDCCCQKRAKNPDIQSNKGFNSVKVNQKDVN